MKILGILILSCVLAFILLVTAVAGKDYTKGTVILTFLVLVAVIMALATLSFVGVVLIMKG